MNPRLTGLVILIFLIWTLFYINVITKSSAGSRPSTPSPGGQHHWIEEESQPSLAQRSQNNEEENNYRRFLRKQFDASEKSYQVCYILSFGSDVIVTNFIQFTITCVGIIKHIFAEIFTRHFLCCRNIGVAEESLWVLILQK